MGRWFEGVCVNYRHPGPRRGEPRVGSAPHVAFPVDPLDPADPADPAQNSPWAPMTVKKQYTGTFFPENEAHIARIPCKNQGFRHIFRENDNENQ